jgi:hypothetical protein
MGGVRENRMTPIFYHPHLNPLPSRARERFVYNPFSLPSWER